MNDILLGKSVLQPADVYLHARYGNRHGMIAGASGIGKSVSLMVMAEGFSRLGVPVFLADVKGDRSAGEISGAQCRWSARAKHPARRARLDHAQVMSHATSGQIFLPRVTVCIDWEQDTK